MKDVAGHESEMSLELELPLPELIGETEILTEDLRRTVSSSSSSGITIS